LKLKIYKNEKKKNTAEPEKRTKYIQKKNKRGKKRKEKVPTDCSHSPAQ
jgi:hypothetical protein